eukprot:6379160-Prymnesium_polylepis.2
MAPPRPTPLSPQSAEPEAAGTPRSARSTRSYRVCRPDGTADATSDSESLQGGVEDGVLAAGAVRCRPREDDDARAQERLVTLKYVVLCGCPDWGLVERCP